MGSWSPLELAATWVFLGIISGCCRDAPLEVVTLSLPWSPLEVGAGYRCQSDSHIPTDLELTQSDSQSPTDLESTQSQNIGNARTKCLYVHEMPIRKSSSGRPVNIIQ